MPLRPVVFTAICLALWLAFSTWSNWSGAEKLRQGGLAGDAGPLAIVVTLDFTPEAFHMTRLQQAGRMLGVQDRIVRLADVTPTDALALAREYWIRSVRRDQP